MDIDPDEMHDIAEAINALREAPEPWMADAICNLGGPPDPDVSTTDPFFAERRGIDAAKAVCETCPVADPCLEYALSNRIDQGVWGGKSERQRMALLRERKDNK